MKPCGNTHCQGRHMNISIRGVHDEGLICLTEEEYEKITNHGYTWSFSLHNIFGVGSEPEPHPIGIMRQCKTTVYRVEQE